MTSVPPAAFVNVIVVSSPAPTVAVAVRATRSLLTSASAPLFVAVTAATTTPAVAPSVAVTGPAAATIGDEQVPFGPAPAATVGVWPAIVKLKFVPVVTPLPATLQMTTEP